MNSGILCVNKPEGVTSFEVVKTLKRKLGAKKVGHCGCLDPLANGVLLICFGKSTKLFNVLSDQFKVYEFTIAFGFETDTQDISGHIINHSLSCTAPAADEIKNILYSFIGDIEQLTPVYSAVKYNGKRSYEYARQGETIKPKLRKVKIYDIKLLKYIYPYVKFRVICSRGTYVRSLCTDLGHKLGFYSTIVSLTRTYVGRFSLNSSLDFNSIRNMPSIELMTYAEVMESL